MKEYTIASLAALALSLGATFRCGLWRERALWLGSLAFAATTVVADVLLTGVGVYGYDRRYNAGIYLGKMPLEDLGYGLALYLVTAVVWSWGKHHDR
jgi:lycopene cyclase domain-containing protein